MLLDGPKNLSLPEQIILHTPISGRKNVRCAKSPAIFWIKERVMPVCRTRPSSPPPFFTRNQQPVCEIGDHDAGPTMKLRHFCWCPSRCLVPLAGWSWSKNSQHHKSIATKKTLEIPRRPFCYSSFQQISVPSSSTLRWGSSAQIRRYASPNGLSS